MASKARKARRREKQAAHKATHADSSDNADMVHPSAPALSSPIDQPVQSDPESITTKTSAPPAQRTERTENAPNSALGRLHRFIAESVTLCVLGAIAGVVGVFFYTPVLLVSGILLYFGLHRSGALAGLSRKKRVGAYMVLSIVMWPGFYALNRAIQRKTSNEAVVLLPGVSLLGDRIMQVLDRMNHKLDTLGDVMQRADPIVHIEPENSLIWSSTPGHTLGVFSLQLLSTSDDVDHLSIQETYFVAERSSSDLLFKRLGGTPPSYEHLTLLKAGEKFSFSVDFRPFSQVAKEIMLNFDGPTLFGVKLLAAYRRHDDGKTFAFQKGYAAINPTAPGIYDSDSEHDRMAQESHGKCPEMAIISDGFNYQTDSLNADEFQNSTGLSLPPCGKKVEGHFPISPRGLLRLSDLELYFNLPGHWVPVIHDVTHGTHR